MAAARERHTAFFLALAEMADPHLRSGDREAWLRRLHRESDNLRAALAWSAAEPHRAGIGLRLAAALAWFWRFYEWLHEGRSWLDAMLARTAEADCSPERAKALYGVGMLAWYQGDLDVAAVRTEASVPLFRSLGDREWIATALRLLGLIRMGQGDPAAGRLFGFARQIAPTRDPFVPAASGADLDRRIAAARARLDAAPFDAGWIAGQALCLDDAIGEALRG